MDFSHFIFAFYVFLLLCGAIWFLGRVMRAGKKKDRSSYEKEHRLFVMYQNVEDMLDSFEEYAEEAKAGIDERLKRMEELIEGLRTEIESRREPKARQKESEPVAKDTPDESAAEPAAERPAEPAVQPAAERRAKPAAEPAQPDRQKERTAKPAAENEAYVKRPQKEAAGDKPRPKTPDLIQQYFEEGMSKEDIAKTLGISMREVSLIMEIKKIHA